LSLTRVSADGCFVGGLISAGVALQLRALPGATAQLPELKLMMSIGLRRLMLGRWLRLLP